MSYVVTPTVEDLNERNRVFFRDRRPPWGSFWLTAAVWLIVLIFVIGHDVPSHVSVRTYLHPVFILLVLIKLYFECRGKPWWLRPVKETTARRYPHLFRKHTFAFDEKSISRLSENEAVNLDWKKLKRIVDAPGGLLFLHGPFATSSFWIPQRVLDGDDSREKILRVAVRHRVPIRQAD